MLTVQCLVKRQFSISFRLFSTPPPHTHTHTLFTQCMLFKFLASDKEDTESVGVQCVKVCGHRVLSDGPGLGSLLEKLVREKLIVVF